MGDMRHIGWLLKTSLPCAVHSESKTFLCSGWLVSDYRGEGTSGQVDYAELMSE